MRVHRCHTELQRACSAINTFFYNKIIVSENLEPQGEGTRDSFSYSRKQRENEMRVDGRGGEGGGGGGEKEKRKKKRNLPSRHFTRKKENKEDLLYRVLTKILTRLIFFH